MQLQSDIQRKKKKNNFLYKHVAKDHLILWKA